MPGAERAGAVRVVDIGFPQDLVRAGAFVTEPADVADVLPHRAADAHKRESGVLLVVAGSRGMTGAPRLIAEAAGRLGAGLIQVAAPASAVSAIQAELTEAVFLPLPETAEGAISPDAVEVVAGALERSDALAIGPGLTAADGPAAAVRSIVAMCAVPLVIDADALNAFAGRAPELATRSAPAVLTPHVGEFGRLTGLKAADVQADRPTHVRELARTADAVTLLKGSRTVIAEPEGRLRINPTGSAVLATAGSGDVLTGAIGALLARGVPVEDAAAAGAYLHGLAGALAGGETGEGTLAGDVAARLPEAVGLVEEQA
jgi:NAD(P)H-hydrate epimerase